MTEGVKNKQYCRTQSSKPYYRFLKQVQSQSSSSLRVSYLPVLFPVMGRNAPNHSRSSPSHRHRRESSPVREKCAMSRSPSPPTRHRSSQKESEKSFGRPEEKSRSPSPRIKRIRRPQMEREVEKGVDKDYESEHRKVDSEKGGRREREREDEEIHAKGGGDKGRRRERDGEIEHERDPVRGGGSEKNMQRERGGDRESGGERKERRSGRDESERTGLRERDGDRENVGERNDRKLGRDEIEWNVQRARGGDKELGRESKERRTGRDEGGGKPSRIRNDRSNSPSDRHNRSRRRSRSPHLADDSRERHEVASPKEAERRNGDDEADSVARMEAVEEALEAKKHKPSFELSGKLAAETNKVRGIELLFTEPPDARKPEVRWRLYVFKGGEALNEPLYIHRQSCYLFGRERRVADIPTDHPSCSKQHAVIQFRQVEKENPDGTFTKQIKPYVMDLGSTNKTFINDDPIEPQRYFELLEKDTIKFGNSSREYVLLHEGSSTS